MDCLTAQRCLQAAQRDAKQYREEAAAVARALEVLILTAADRAGGGEAAGPESPLGFFGE